jgi:hypothetical protein
VVVEQRLAEPVLACLAQLDPEAEQQIVFQDQHLLSALERVCLAQRPEEEAVQPLEPVVAQGLVLDLASAAQRNLEVVQLLEQSEEPVEEQPVEQAVERQELVSMRGCVIQLQ